MSVFAITIEIVRDKLMCLREELDLVKPSIYAQLPNRQQELYWLIAQEFFPQLIVEIFPDWRALPAGTSFCLERVSRRG